MKKETWLTDNIAGLWFDDFDSDFWEDEEYVVGMFADKFNEATVKFAKSILKKGIKEPIVIRRDEFADPRYGLMNGHHRFLFAYILGITEIPAYVVDDIDWRESWKHPHSHVGKKRMRELVEEIFDIRIDSLQSL